MNDGPSLTISIIQVNLHIIQVSTLYRTHYEFKGSLILHFNTYRGIYNGSNKALGLSFTVRVY